MAKRKTMVPFNGTPEQEAALMQVISEHEGHKDALIPILQKAQEIYGYLPEEVQKMIAKGMGISLSEVYGVVTFYAQFTLNPQGQNHIAVCLGTACYVKGAQAILDKIKDQLHLELDGITPDGKYSLQATRCIGACGLAPVLTINGEVHGRMTADQVPAVLAQYK